MRELKPKMTFDEMAELFVQDNPAFLPNRSTVGRYAKRLGYMPAKQMVNKVMTYFYVLQNTHNNG